MEYTLTSDVHLTPLRIFSIPELQSLAVSSVARVEGFVIAAGFINFATALLGLCSVFLGKNHNRVSQAMIMCALLPCIILVLAIQVRDFAF